MESDAQWKEVLEFSKQFHGAAENAINKYFENSEELRPHRKSADIFIQTFKGVLGKKNETTQAKKKAVQMGMARLKFTSELVSNMHKELEKDKDALHGLVEEAHVYAQSIEQEKVNIIEVNRKLEEDSVEEDEQTKESRRLAAECEAELASVMPAIEKALQSLDLLKPTDIAFMKSMKNPPGVIKVVVAAICVMLEIAPEQGKTGKEDLGDLYWGPAKKLLGDVNFMRRLRDYDKDNIPEAIVANLRTHFLSNPDFEPTRVARASIAAESLCKWVIAMEKYDKVSKEILRPKREALKKAQESLGQTLQSIRQNKSTLTATEQQVLDLEGKLQQNEAKKNELQGQISQKDGAMVRARELIDGLAGENDKWTQVLEECRGSYNTMVGDSLLVAGTITYLGPLPQDDRAEVMASWRALIATSQHNIKCSDEDKFAAYKFYNDALTLEKWRTSDFPQDPYWLDNATIMTNSGRFWPLAVDPLGVANKLIKGIEKDNPLMIAKPSDENFIGTLKDCIANGQPMLIEDITEKLDPQLAELLTKKSGKSPQAEAVTIGEGEAIPVHKEFRLYMTTRLRNVRPFYYFSPDEEKERESSFTVINFVPPIPESLALQHALLSGVIAKEKRKLEAERLAVIEKVSMHKRRTIEIGEKVLNVLSNPQGGRIISVEMTLGVLEAKKPLIELEQQMKEDEEHMKKIDSSLDSFRKLTIKLAKRFCSPDCDVNEPFDLEGFIQSAL